MKKLLRAAALAVLASVALAGFAAAPALADYSDCTNRTLYVVNHSSHTIQSVISSNRDSNNWSGDHLGSYVLDPGEEMMIDVDDGTGYHIYDLIAYTDDDYEADVRLNACTESQWFVYDEDFDGGDY